MPERDPGCPFCAGVECTYDPTELAGQPIGMLHCPECGIMLLAGIGHLPCDCMMDWDAMWDALTTDLADHPELQVEVWYADEHGR